MANEEVKNECAKCKCKKCTLFVVVFVIILFLLIILISLLATDHYDDVILPGLIELKLVEHPTVTV